MTVSTSTAKAGPYAGAGSVGPFTVPFRFLDASHLQVIRTATNGVDSVLVLTTDYTVSGVGLASGSVTLTTALASGEKLTVIRSVPFTQEADYVNNDAFPAESHETALDKLTMQTQQLKERVDAALTLPATAAGVSTTLPAPVAGNVIGWDQGGTGLQNYTMPDLVSTAVYADWKYKTFVGNGSTVSYVLDTAPGNIANLDVSFDGVTQVPGTDFTLSGNVVTFTSAPPNGVNILFRYGSSVAEQTSAFTVERKTATASQTVFTLGNVYVPGANNLAVYVNGLRLSAGDDYIETNSTTVTFTSGLASGDEVTFVVGREISGATGAENVSFLQAGTGAVARDVQAKLRDEVSVKDFGAKGDGVTDDTAAIQAAINRIKAIGGGVLVFPAAIYKISNTLNIAGDFGFRGIEVVGNGSQINSTADSPAFLVDAYAGGGGASAPSYRISATIRGFYLNGPGTGLTSSVGVKVQLSANVLVKECNIRNFRIGLEGFGVLLCGFEDLQIHGNFVGVSFTKSVTPVLFACNDNHFRRCHVFENTKGIFYSTGGGGNVSFEGCEIESNNLGSTGITDGVSSVELFLCGKVTFNSCYFEENRGQYNIVYSSQDGTGSLNLIGCQFLLNAQTGYGVYLDATAGVPASLTMIGCSVGATATNDLYVGDGFSATLIDTPVVNAIGGFLRRLVRIENGQIISGGQTSSFAQILANGGANPFNVAIDVNGLLRLTDATGDTRYGFISGNGTAVSLIADYGYVQIGKSDNTRLVISRLGGATVEPNVDATHSLGTASRRWGTMFSVNAKFSAVTVSALPAASTIGAGARAFVSDATATTFASVVVGGGANNVPVYSDGTAWRIG